MEKANKIKRNIKAPFNYLTEENLKKENTKVEN